MKRYLIYYDEIPEGGISATDYINAKRKALLITPKENKRHIRVRLANKPLLEALAQQKEYGH